MCVCVCVSGGGRVPGREVMMTGTKLLSYCLELPLASIREGEVASTSVVCPKWLHLLSYMSRLSFSLSQSSRNKL